MTGRSGSPAELALLWAAVGDGDYVESLSDGQRRWAFLFELVNQGAGALFPGSYGAILLVEENVGPISVELYGARAELVGAWQTVFTQPRLAKACG